MLNSSFKVSCNFSILIIIQFSLTNIIIYYLGTSELKDHDYLMLQFLGTKGAWLGCAGSACGLATCPSYNDYYHFFDGRCYGEELQIIGEGIYHSQSN